MNKSSIYQVLNQEIAEQTAPGSMFEIAEIEVRGVTMKAWKNAPNSLRDVWLSTAAFADREHIIYQDERLTFTQTHENVARIANWLVANGIEQHDRIAIAMRNYPEWMQWYWAAICIGAVPVGVNAWWVAEELEYGLKDSGPKLIVCDKERLARFEEVRDGFESMKVVTVRVDSPPEWATPHSQVMKTQANMPSVEIDTGDDACIFYTSGTTGFPKGAQLTHQGCTNNIMSYLFSLITQSRAEAIVNGEVPPDPNDPNAEPPAGVVTTPLFHVTANNTVAHAVAVRGGKLVHMYKWDAGEALKIIEKEKITNFSGVPVMGREIISHPDFDKTDTSSLTIVGGGGAAVQPDLIEKISNRATQRIAPAQGYGLTECCGVASVGLGIFLENKPTSAGMMAPIYDVKCTDENGNELPQGETGVIHIRSPQIIKGYLNRPDATAEDIVDGWFNTGDIGFVDEDNFIYLVDRAKDMVLRGGENVYCSEVEVAIFKYEGVAECAVFGVPDERLGEEVGVAILAEPEARVDVNELRVFCKSKLAAFKIPRYVWLVDQPLPRNASGKFVKRELQENLSINDAL